MCSPRTMGFFHAGLTERDDKKVRGVLNFRSLDDLEAAVAAAESAGDDAVLTHHLSRFFLAITNSLETDARLLKNAADGATAYARVCAAFGRLYRSRRDAEREIRKLVHKIAEEFAQRGAGANVCELVSVPLLLTVVLPLLEDALPRDTNGVCVIPHEHRMVRQEAQEAARFFTGSGRQAFNTHKVCDNCQGRILDRFFYHCSVHCDIDFCADCYRKLQGVFEEYCQKHGDFGALDDEVEECQRGVSWVMSMMDHLAGLIVRLPAVKRQEIAHELACRWSSEMFRKLVGAVTDVLNARVVHVQDVKDIKADENFWLVVVLLQFLYAVNSLPGRHKVDVDAFVLEGINKCEPQSEWNRWRAHPKARVPDLLSVDPVKLTGDFCSFLTHSNLVPVSFRRFCLLCDVREPLSSPSIQVRALRIEVRRDPAQLLNDVLHKFGSVTEVDLRRPLRVTFQGESSSGPGVTREFFQVSLRSFLQKNDELQLFRYNEQQRTFWFQENASSAASLEALRICGILLGQAVLNNVLVPNIFPHALYELLLHDLNSPRAKPMGIADLASVCQETASSLQKVLDYTGPDIGSVFGDLGLGDLGCVNQGSALTQANKRCFVLAFVDWFLRKRIAKQLAALSMGFQQILGSSRLLQSMVDSVQLEKIVCGGNIPVDIAAIRTGATHAGWTQEEERIYLEMFWDVLHDLTEAQKVQLVVFITASDRVPLRGWQDLQVIVQKNGVGNERLPTAHTCFAQLLLPKYTSRERLMANLLLAISNSEGFGLQ